jgi:ABC-type phosphate transport system auxiliary subunit
VEQSNTLGGIREAMVSLENRLQRRFERVDQRFDALDAKMSRQFMWLAGMLLTTLVAVVAALVTR